MSFAPTGVGQVLIVVLVALEFGGNRGRGGGGTNFFCCPCHLTIDHASLSRWSGYRGNCPRRTMVVGFFYSRTWYECGDADTP